MRIFFLSIFAFAVLSSAVFANEPLDIGNQRELFIDDYLVGSMKNVEFLVHKPQREELAFTGDAPWEGNGCLHVTVFQADGFYHMYYHAWHLDVEDGSNESRPVKWAYQRSRDGIHWERPNLGLVEFNGSKENNLFLDDIETTEPHDFCPFVDTNPDCTPDARFKALVYGYPRDGHGPWGLWAMKSSDAVHWELFKSGPVYSEGKFDTQNVSFWSELEQQYVVYYREKDETGPKAPFRYVCRAVSDDFANWKNEGPLVFPEGEGPIKPDMQFYTNVINPYYRAPHIYIGFPVRYIDNGLTHSTMLLPEPELREKRIKTSTRMGTAVTDSALITSRDGLHFRQANDVFLPPGLRTKHNWTYGDNFIAKHVVETDSPRDDMPRELSLYTSESYQTGKTSRIRRYTLRIDGFCSIHAKSQPGELVTKPLVFSGKTLSLNMGTSAAGFVKVEFCDSSGKPIPGYTLDDCDIIYGDSLDRTVSWNGNEDVSSLVGKPTVLRFVLKEADLYSLVFENDRAGDKK